jgi:hypothetical protein
LSHLPRAGGNVVEVPYEFHELEDHRLIVHIRYSTGTNYIKGLLAHAQYDKGTWKE